MSELEADRVEARRWRTARVAVAAQLIYAGALILVVGVLTAAENGVPVGSVPKHVVALVPFGLLYTLPAVVGALGIRRRTRLLLAAAGSLDLLGSFLAFSGVTLIFLIPGLFFLSAAAVRRGNRRGRAAPAR